MSDLSCKHWVRYSSDLSVTFDMKIFNLQWITITCSELIFCFEYTVNFFRE